jgi:multiple sugar transport system substrate-binding protein
MKLYLLLKLLLERFLRNLKDFYASPLNPLFWGTSSRQRSSKFPRRFLRRRVIVFLAIALTLLTCCTQATPVVETSNGAQPKVLRIFWRRGFFPEEDQALQSVIREWEQKSSIPVELSLLSPDDVLNQAMIELEQGNPPDIVFAHRADYTLEPRWALEDKLLDVSDVVETVKDQYSPIALKASYFYNQARRQSSFYGVPIEMQALHIHYWRDRLAEIGLSDADIPNDWDGFWQFWQRAQAQFQAQAEARSGQAKSTDQSTDQSTGKSKVYGLGLTLSPASSDSFFLFEQLLEDYNIELLDEQGNLKIDQPQVRAGIIRVLTWLTTLYQQHYIPPESLKWVDSDNNVNFLNRNVLMTANPSLSIPVTQKGNPDLYLKKIVTRPFPNDPDGKPGRLLVSVKQALIFKTAKQTEAAKDFLTYFVQPDRLNQYLTRSLGRWYPPMPAAIKTAFWQSKDPHISVAIKQFSDEIRPFYHVLNPAYSQVQAESIWGQAIARVIGGQTPEAAVDEAIAQIQKIFKEWGNSSA